MRFVIILAASFFFPLIVFSQIGGTTTYQFLSLTNSARVAALGGNNISLYDHDLNLVYHNPALLDKNMDNNVVVNYVNYFTDINYGYVSYARYVPKLGNFAAGIHHINYGRFTETDEAGTITGKFFCSEYALNLVWSQKIDSLFTFGANLKPVLSILESYKSFGILADAAISYISNKRHFSASLVFKNMGSQIRPYTKGNIEPVDFDIQVGFTKRIKHAPFRLSVTAQHLEKPDMTYTRPDYISGTDIALQDTGKKESKVADLGDKFMRHIIVGVEILPTDNFFIAFGYNYQRRQELKLDTRSFLVGMSIGVGLRISKFRISYGRASYHLAGASNHFSISANLADFYKKKQP